MIENDHRLVHWRNQYAQICYDQKLGIIEPAEFERKTNEIKASVAETFGTLKPFEDFIEKEPLYV